jgi:hypothetical protein
MPAEAPLAPPHPFSAHSRGANPTNTSIRTVRRRIRKHPNAIAITANERKRESTGCMFVPNVAGALMVSVEMPVPLTLPGANAHVAPVGSPEQLRETTPLKPLNPLMRTVVSPEALAGTVIDVGSTDRLKSGTMLMT